MHPLVSSIETHGSAVFSKSRPQAFVFRKEERGAWGCSKQSMIDLVREWDMLYAMLFVEP